MWRDVLKRRKTGLERYFGPRFNDIEIVRL